MRFSVPQPRCGSTRAKLRCHAIQAATRDMDLQRAEIPRL
jgi:hypothetical protein